MKIIIDLADGDWDNLTKIIEAIASIKSDTTPFACLTINDLLLKETIVLARSDEFDKGFKTAQERGEKLINKMQETSRKETLKEVLEWLVKESDKQKTYPPKIGIAEFKENFRVKE